MGTVKVINWQSSPWVLWFNFVCFVGWSTLFEGRHDVLFDEVGAWHDRFFGGSLSYFVVVPVNMRLRLTLSVSGSAYNGRSLWYASLNLNQVADTELDRLGME